MIEGTQQAADNVRARLQRLREERAVYLAATGTMVVVSKRVWGVGGLTDGGFMSYDNDYELYAYKPPSPKAVTHRGKPYKLWEKAGLRAPKTKGGSVKAGARKINGGWYKDYQAYKTQQSRPDSPFELTGRLRKAYFGGTNQPEPHQDSDTEVTIRLRGEEATKYEGLTDAKGTFLGLTEFEKADYQRRLLALYNA